MCLAWSGSQSAHLRARCCQRPTGHATTQHTLAEHRQASDQWCTDIEILQSFSNPKLFHQLHIRKYKIMDSDIQSKSETAQSIAH